MQAAVREVQCAGVGSSSIEPDRQQQHQRLQCPTQHAPDPANTLTGHEAGGQVLQDNAIGGCEEGEHIGDEVALIVRQLDPVAQVLGQVHLLGSPEAGLRLLVVLKGAVVPAGWEQRGAGSMARLGCCVAGTLKAVSRHKTRQRSGEAATACID